MSNVAHKLLMKPEHTLKIAIAGCTALGTMFGAQVAAITPLSGLPFLQGLKPHILWLEGALATAAGVCLFLAAFGRSISPLIDNGGDTPPSDPGQSADLPKAA